jgi:hypothetical protein
MILRVMGDRHEMQCHGEIGGVQCQLSGFPCEVETLEAISARKSCSDVSDRSISRGRKGCLIS